MAAEVEVSVLAYLQACVNNVNVPLVGGGVLASLAVHFLLCTFTTPYYASHAVLLAGSLALAVLGTMTFLDQADPGSLPLNAQGTGPQELLSNVMLIYQLFNLVVTAQVKELQKISMAVHHLVTILLAITSLSPFAIYYGGYFFGVVEISNIPLTVHDLIEYYSARGNKVGAGLSMAKGVAGGVFVLTFFGTRVIGWVAVSKGFWAHAIESLGEGATSGTTFAVLLFLISNAFLSLLQAKWSVDIIKLVLEILGVRSTKSERKEK
eukprot:INCI11806.1.p1 GENE.INCI11806.1~~INCI11806.1.p1  ORF type:complete len:292 (-),score=47.25 INCI11806.1:214-1008(-)